MAELYKLPEYEQHPIAKELFPSSMEAEEFQAFKDDCLERGILMPATLYDGKILDGWHRYRVAKLLQCGMDFREYTGKDPAGQAAALNVHRRKLSSLQRALVGAKLHKNHGLTQRQACKRLGISNEVLNLVLKALESKNATIIKRLEHESDYTRGQLREELHDAGLLRGKVEAQGVPEGVANSVFNVAANPPPRTGKEGTVVLGEGAFNRQPATEEEVEEKEEVDEILDTPSLQRERAKPRKPRETAVQAAADTFKALREEEQVRFMTVVWPIARKVLAPVPGWKQAVQLMDIATGTKKAMVAIPKGEEIKVPKPRDTKFAKPVPVKTTPRALKEHALLVAAGKALAGKPPAGKAQGRPLAGGKPRPEPTPSGPAPRPSKARSKPGKPSPGKGTPAKAPPATSRKR